MKEIGIVVKIEGSHITIQGGELAACFGCMNQECRSNGKRFVAENSLALPLQVGQTVEVEQPHGTLWKQTLLLFLPPLLVFGILFWGSGSLFPLLSQDFRVALGIGGIFGVWGIQYFVRKGKPLGEGPRVTRIIEASLETNGNT
ncbi:MAG: SoxR reducing system RseC family protein [Treponemataceae bacterium]|nr:SoxR reducing system RseC family protein [Treponemataceae bacterium]